jgi:hypothetical protein
MADLTAKIGWHVACLVSSRDHRPEGAPERAERGDTMPMDNWYDLAIRELSDLTDLAKEKLAEAEQGLPEPAPEAEDEETPEPPPARLPQPS